MVLLSPSLFCLNKKDRDLFLFPDFFDNDTLPRLFSLGFFLSKEVFVENTIAVVLAAGKGKRMNSQLPKVVHTLKDKPMILWVMDALKAAGIYNMIPVIAPSQDLIKELISQKADISDFRIQYGLQEEQLGTAHAVSCGLKMVERFEKIDKNNLKIIVAYGDTPAIKGETFKNLMQVHHENQNHFTVLAFKADNPFGYGRLILDPNGQFLAIREQKDCSEEETKIDVCNSGILCANYFELLRILPQIQNHNSAKEYYLTDVPLCAKEQGLKVGLITEYDEVQFLGINTQEQLKELEAKLS